MRGARVGGGLRSLPFPSPAAGGARFTAMRGDTGEVDAAPSRCLSSREAAARSAVPAAAGSGGGGAGTPAARGAPRGGGGGAASPPPPHPPHFPRRRPFPGKLGYCGLLSPRRWGRAGRGQAAGRAAELRGRAALAPAPPAAAAGRGEAGGGALPPAALARSGSPAALCPGASPASVCLWARARWGVPASSPLPGREVVPQLRSLPPSAGGERSRTPRLGCFLV